MVHFREIIGGKERKGKWVWGKKKGESGDGFSLHKLER